MIMVLSNPGSVHYPTIFRPGDVIKAVKDNLPWDRKGKVITVTEETEAFYNVWAKCYAHVAPKT